MVCKDCGYVMAPFETSCPRCVRLKAAKKTRRLPDLRSMATQHLVKLEQCPHCNFMLFPGDSICSSCGSPVTKKFDARGKSAQMLKGRDRAPLIVGIAISAATVGIVLFLYHSFYTR